RAEVAEREAGGVIALRGAIDEEPASPRAPGLGGEPLSALEGGMGTDVDPLEASRDVEVERRLAQLRDRRWVCSGPALVPRNVEATWPAPGVIDDGVQIGSLVLLAVARLRLQSVARHSSWTVVGREVRPQGPGTFRPSSMDDDGPPRSTTDIGDPPSPGEPGSARP